MLANAGKGWQRVAKGDEDADSQLLIYLSYYSVRQTGSPIAKCRGAFATLKTFITINNWQSSFPWQGGTTQGTLQHTWRGTKCFVIHFLDNTSTAQKDFYLPPAVVCKHKLQVNKPCIIERLLGMDPGPTNYFVVLLNSCLTLCTSFPALWSQKLSPGRKYMLEC